MEAHRKKQNVILGGDFNAEVGSRLEDDDCEAHANNAGNDDRNIAPGDLPESDPILQALIARLKELETSLEALDTPDDDHLPSCVL